MNKSKVQKNPDKVAKPSVFSLLKPYRVMVSFLIVFALLSNAVNLILPKIIARAIDAFGAGNFVLKTVVLEFLIASLVIFVFTYLQSILQTFASEKVARDLRSRLSDKISRQSYAYILKTNPSKLLTNLTSDIDSIKMFVSMAVVTIFSSLFMIIGTCFLLLMINYKLAVPIIAIIPVIGGTFFIVLRKVRVLFKRSREVIDWLNRVINESVMGSAIIRVLNSQQSEYHKFLEANTDARNIGLGILRLFAALIPIITFVSNLGMITILMLGGHFVITGSMSLGDFAAFNSYLALLIFPIIMIGFMSNIIAQASASYQRINDVLEAPETLERGTVKTSLQGNIELDHVSLSYEGKPVLKDISFQVKGGTQVAILGPTAAGKSQLLNLLTDLVKPDSGNILFDKRKIEDYEKESFRNQIGFVLQDSVIFNMSLRENIAFSDVATDESLEKAINTAEMRDFVDSLPDKLNTIVSERGTSLSGGQKQRIMLARALALNPKILLLDDFTSRVDQNTEKKILANLAVNYPELTLLSITQKVASVKHFEQIILLMEGEVIAKGTHNELMETCTEYVQISDSQRSTSHYEL
ncbi:MAG TPA: ABC transporter ATP-binding protein [Prolixibacteraceae bacterium]|nr:ABC transporter ATP-binding protein [Prolixibacteraceae bacterium]